MQHILDCLVLIKIKDYMMIWEKIIIVTYFALCIFKHFVLFFHIIVVIVIVVSLSDGC